MTTAVTQMVLNPSWQVPRRIKELVLDPLADQDPRRYDDFELSVGRDGVERAVQRPGPRNAMGRIKLVLAESPLVLHGTPGRRPFNQRQRALSHGNVRVETARELAMALLEADGHEVTPEAARRVLDTRRETFLTLKRPVPLSVHYTTVEVTDDGTIRFHPDVYGYFDELQGRGATVSVR
jgi:murein L,D-transpeptidase YcbB/YkuD